MDTQTTRFIHASLGQNHCSCFTGCDIEPIASDIRTLDNIAGRVNRFMEGLLPADTIDNPQKGSLSLFGNQMSHTHHSVTHCGGSLGLTIARKK